MLITFIIYILSGIRHLKVLSEVSLKHIAAVRLNALNMFNKDVFGTH